MSAAVQEAPVPLFKKKSAAQQTATEILAGSFGGVVQVLTGQPFDTIKVRLQSQSGPETLYKGTWDCVAQTAKNEGPLAFYKGTLSPLVGIAFCVSIQFAVLEKTKRIFAEMNQKSGLTGSSLSPIQYYVAGGIAGVANSVVSGPVEHIRTRMQVQSTTGPQYKSTVDCFNQILSRYGLRGVYKGQVITILREWQGYAGYFFVYETLVKRATESTGKKVNELPTWQVMSFGAAAGYGMWLPVYPLDVIKSRIQTDSLDPSNRKYRGWVDCFLQTVRQDGFRGLYRGIVPCMLRAAPVNAATFAAYEFAMRKLGRT